MKRARLDRNRVRKYRRAMARYLVDVSASDVEAAAGWYGEARLVATDVANRMGVSLECGASIVSAFSPRERWSRNITLAIDFAEGRPTACLGNSRRSAERARVQGFDALKGDKVNAFARAIAGDSEAVVVDVWMQRAAGLDRDLTVVQYREVSSAVRSLARQWGLEPATMQALIWIKVRGGAL